MSINIERLIKLLEFADSLEDDTEQLRVICAIVEVAQRHQSPDDGAGDEREASR
jgi:hypothetical protein